MRVTLQLFRHFLAILLTLKICLNWIRLFVKAIYYLSIIFGFSVVIYHIIDSLYSTNSVNVYVPSDNQQFRYKIAKGW